MGEKVEKKTEGRKKKKSFRHGDFRQRFSRKGKEKVWRVSVSKTEWG